MELLGTFLMIELKILACLLRSLLGWSLIRIFFLSEVHYMCMTQDLEHHFTLSKIFILRI